MSSTTTVTQSHSVEESHIIHAVGEADGDLEGYDEEQIRLMEEVCIVVDNDDNPMGSSSKKTCKLSLLLSRLAPT